MRVPDCPGPILGWRVWRVSANGRGLRLRSALRDDVWEPGREFVADCEHRHRAPAEGCACGVHAVRRADSARCYLVGRDDPCDVHRVIGEVALWGWVLEGERGWRASRAYPSRLWIPPRHDDPTRPSLDEIARELTAYDVPVERG